MKQRILTILWISMLVLPQVSGQTVPPDLVRAIGNGDAASMSAWFHQSLEMTILEQKYETSKNQASRILESFFKSHTPSAFTVSFEGTKEQSKYAIGTLSTDSGNFRINIYFLMKEGKRLIYYLSIEKESPYELRPKP
ncbi:MAG: DUF4783 domain-containing protein [Bacteroidales bacterium]|nr:DUF4783 domain-containing protein [Bacteroidales bacterium]